MSNQPQAESSTGILRGENQDPLHGDALKEHLTDDPKPPPEDAEQSEVGDYVRKLQEYSDEMLTDIRESSVRGRMLWEDLTTMFSSSVDEVMRMKSVHFI